LIKERALLERKARLLWWQVPDKFCCQLSFSMQKKINHSWAIDELPDASHGCSEKGG